MLLTKSIDISVDSGKDDAVAANTAVPPVQAIPTQNGASFRRRRFAPLVLSHLAAQTNSAGIDVMLHSRWTPSHLCATLARFASANANALLIKTSHQSNPIFECIGPPVLVQSMYL
jgi:hypothetical protein